MFDVVLEPPNMKKRKPMHSMPPSAIVIGLVRRPPLRTRDMVGFGRDPPLHHL